MRYFFTPKVLETPAFKWLGYGTDNEHNQTSRSSTSQRGGEYLNRSGINKNVTFKANKHTHNRFHKTWDSKKDLIHDQLKSKFSNQIGPPSNRTGQRSFLKRNHCGGRHGKFKKINWSLIHSSTGWYSVFVFKVDEDNNEVLKTMQTDITPVAFYPYNKQYSDNTLRFLVDNDEVSKALYDAKKRYDQKFTLKVSTYLPPHDLISLTPVSSEVREKMIEAMATRYNHSNKSFDLSKFHECPLFTNNQLFVPLNRPAVLLAALNMVAQHTKHDLYSLSLENNHIYLSEGLNCLLWLFPKLKVLNLASNKLSHLKELKCLSGYTIEELNLSRNHVSDRNNKEHYIRDVLQLFPILNKLNCNFDTAQLYPI